MDFILGGRQSGKTQKLMEWAQTHGAVVLVINEKERRRLQDLYPGVPVSTVDSYRSSKTYRSSNLEGPPLGIDNVDLVLSHQLGCTPTIGTATGREVDVRVPLFIEEGLPPGPDCAERVRLALPKVWAATKPTLVGEERSQGARQALGLLCEFLGIPHG